jgi:pyridoxine 4-dehydrogenase
MELRMEQSPGAELAGTIDLGDLTVNRLGFGAMRPCGDSAWGKARDRGHATRVLHRAVELGVNFIDTADRYGPETNESSISQAL